MVERHLIQALVAGSKGLGLMPEDDGHETRHKIAPPAFSFYRESVVRCISLGALPSCFN